MSEPYVGEIRLFAGNFAPQNWMMCDGQLLPISEYDVLFNLIGTTYGGDGQQTFALPDLRGRVPYHMGSGFVPGQKAGEESVTLTGSQAPLHTHGLPCNGTSASSPNPSGKFFGLTGSTAFAPGTSANATMNPASVGVAGNANALPHENRMPTQAVTFIISLYGIYPSQS